MAPTNHRTDWVPLSDPVKYSIVHSMTRSGLSFTRTMDQLGLDFKDQAQVIELIAKETAKMRNIDEEIAKTLPGEYDPTWLEQAPSYPAPIVDQIPPKEIQQGCEFLKFMGLDKVAKDLDSYRGMAVTFDYQIPIVDHLESDGIAGLIPHFNIGCHSRLKALSESAEERGVLQPRGISSAEVLARMDPPEGTITPRRLERQDTPAELAAPTRVSQIPDGQYQVDDEGENLEQAVLKKSAPLVQGGLQVTDCRAENMLDLVRVFSPQVEEQADLALEKYQHLIKGFERAEEQQALEEASEEDSEAQTEATGRKRKKRAAYESDDGEWLEPRKRPRPSGTMKKKSEPVVKRPPRKSRLKDTPTPKTSVRDTTTPTGSVSGKAGNAGKKAAPSSPVKQTRVPTGRPVGRPRKYPLPTLGEAAVLPADGQPADLSLSPAKGSVSGSPECPPPSSSRGNSEVDDVQDKSVPASMENGRSSDRSIAQLRAPFRRPPRRPTAAPALVKSPMLPVA
ncbi:hypothetical protein QBC47DRAFT_65256 [Echria macrotheca]|uniref:Uncharacterized protein n=1 Tax=Echria macrotheca TaxID=438768 RepID=A0AAJ0B5L3_9PEZI|nr:hypothetical protein QBC47DRAFT_65256 [Echria macrotheca]